MRLRSQADLERYRCTLETGPRGAREIVITTHSTCCQLRGSAAVAAAFQEELERAGLRETLTVRHSGCLGFCEIEPMVLIGPPEVLYRKVTAADVAEIVERTLRGAEVIERLLYEDPATGRKYRNREEMPFYRKQERSILGLNERIDPTRIEDYIARGGYAALAAALAERSPEGIIEEVRRSGLRGRGGGGFPVAVKWQSGREAPAEDGLRYVICNADEGDPGAYMDRSVLEGNPHSVIEGMIIGSRAIGSHEGYVYVRAEYPLAVRHLKLAIAQAEELGLLGEDILGSGHDFRIRIVQGAGAFVCGESTALMASLEGRVGRPRAKYVHTVERGLWNRPTVLNNVETWANVTRLFTIGAEAFASIGTSGSGGATEASAPASAHSPGAAAPIGTSGTFGSKGTKIFSLVGKIHNTGLVEVPMGITLREIIYDIGGGIPNGKQFKAVQTGGPSGGCLPEELLDLPVDFDELTRAGSMMGSGGMIVMDEDTCMVDVARYFLEFLKGESCGKCVPCREGVRRMHQILERICAGRGREEDLDLLEEMGGYLKDTALCALGATAANPVRTTLRYFRPEYEAHIRERWCPAGVCQALFEYRIDARACTGCGACRKACPVQAIRGERKAPHEIDPSACIRCGICREACRFGAVGKARRNPIPNEVRA